MELHVVTAANQDGMCDHSNQEHRVTGIQRQPNEHSHTSCLTGSISFISPTMRNENAVEDREVLPASAQFTTIVSSIDVATKTPSPTIANSAKKQRTARKPRQNQAETISELSNNEPLTASGKKAGKYKSTGPRLCDSPKQPDANDSQRGSAEKRQRKRKTDALGGDRPVTGSGKQKEIVDFFIREPGNNAKKQSKSDQTIAGDPVSKTGENNANTVRVSSGVQPIGMCDELPASVESNYELRARTVPTKGNILPRSTAARETRGVQTDMNNVQVNDLLVAVETMSHVPVFVRPKAVAGTRVDSSNSNSTTRVSGNLNVSTSLVSASSANFLSNATSITQTLDSRIESLRCEIPRLKSEKEQLGRELTRHEALQPEAVKLLQELLLQKSDLEKEQLRERCSVNKYRLGEFQYVRQGSALVEQLTEGVSFQKIRRRRNEIAGELNEVEKRRRAIVKMSRDKHKQQQAAVGDSVVIGSTAISTSTAANTVPGGAQPTGTVSGGTTTGAGSTCSLEELFERDEILKLRTAALRKEDAELQREFERLSRDRLVHSKQLKRIEAEDASRFRSTLERPRVLNDRYLLLELIGKGGFSEVHRAYDLVAMRYVACKIHEHSAAWSREYRDSFVRHVVREIEIQKTLRHPHIVSIYDAFDIDANALCTVLEHVHGHDLDFHLKQHQYVAEREARAIVLQIVAALVYLNEQNPAIIHYDLKPANILLSLDPLANTNTFSIKITDFGLSKLVQRPNDDGGNGPESDATTGTELTSQGVGTYWYLPPECFFGIGPNSFAPADDAGGPTATSTVRISNKVDVWSLGVVFYNMVYGCKPFGHGMSQQEILRTNLIVAKGRDVTFPAKPNVSLDARRFIMRCLTYEKELRPDVFAIAKDLYLQRDFTARKRNIATKRNAKDSLSGGGMQQGVNSVQRMAGAGCADDGDMQDDHDETGAGESDEHDGDDDRDDGDTA